MHFSTINPYTQEELRTYITEDGKIARKKIEAAASAFTFWRRTSPAQKSEWFLKLSKELLSRKEELAVAVTLEMGKPIIESRLEIEKCATVCRYYAEQAEKISFERRVERPSGESYVRYEPLGVILGIMPWNFPFWQVFRFAIPTLLAGNTIIVKHAQNVTGCALLIEDVFRRADLPPGVFSVLVKPAKKVLRLIDHPLIQGVSLTGSVAAGSEVAGTAGEHIKKTVLELGGSNAFLVFKDADLDLTVKSAVRGRFGNAGQSCIAAKRFIVHDGIFEEFSQRFAMEIMRLRIGDPMDEQTQIGPLARLDLAEEVEKQVNRSIRAGARLVLGGMREGAIFQPTLLTHVQQEMPVFNEEVFGPVAAVVRASTEEEMIRLSNCSEFGLGVNLFSQDIDRMKSIVPEFNEGAVFINDVVKSDPALPFGGIKKSGYGRELGEDGIFAFVNIKTVVVA